MTAVCRKTSKLGNDQPPADPSRQSNVLLDAVMSGNERGQQKYRSFRELPRKTHICGGIILLIGIVNLALMLFKIEWNGLLWLFFYSIPANTAISVFPHEPVIVYCGQHFNAIVVTLVATAGNLVAGWVDYPFFTPVLQMKFSEKYRKTKVYRQALHWFSIAPFWVVAVFALTPLPFYLVKFMVYSSAYPMSRYLLGILVGRLPRIYLLALLGHALQVPTWMMVVFFSLIFVVYIFIFVRGWVKTKFGKGITG